MDLHSKIGWFRAAGLVALLGLGACDSGAAPKVDEAKKAEPAKTDVKPAEPVKTEPVKVEPAKTDPAADVKAADAANPDAKAADAANPDAKAADTKVADAKAPDAKAADTKTDDKKGSDAKKDVPKVAAIDGKPLFEAKCKSCHGLDGKGTPAMLKKNVPDLTDKAWQTGHSKAKVIAAVTNGVEGTPMKSFKDKLKAEEIDAIATYVKKLK